MNILEWVLRHNYFSFADRNQLQTDGVAMGTPAAVAVSDLSLTWHEEKKIPPSIITIIYFKRFIDDVLIIGNPHTAHLVLDIIDSATRWLKAITEYFLSDMMY